MASFVSVGVLGEGVGVCVGEGGSRRVVGSTIRERVDSGSVCGRGEAETAARSSRVMRGLSDSFMVVVYREMCGMDGMYTVTFRGFGGFILLDDGLWISRVCDAWFRLGYAEVVLGKRVLEMEIDAFAGQGLVGGWWWGGICDRRSGCCGVLQHAGLRETFLVAGLGDIEGFLRKSRLVFAKRDIPYFTAQSASKYLANPQYIKHRSTFLTVPLHPKLPRALNTISALPRPTNPPIQNDLTSSSKPPLPVPLDKPPPPPRRHIL